MKTLARVLVAVGAAFAVVEPTYAWTISQNFDSSAVGATCGGWDAAGASKVSAEKSYSAPNGCKMSINAGDTAFGTWGGIINHPAPLKRGDQLWFRVRMFMPIGFNYNSPGEGNHLKFFRFHTMSAASSNIGYDDIYINPPGSNPPFLFIYEGEQVWDSIGSLSGVLSNPLSGPANMPIVLGTWETYEYYVKFDTVPVSKGGMARVRFWKSGVLMADITDRITLATADAYSDRTHLFTYWNGGSPATQSLYIDDVVLTSDTPSAKDALGNPYIGVGTPQPSPEAPKSLSVQ